MRTFVFLKSHFSKMMIPVIVIIVILLIWVGYKATWTGFKTKILWDWMELLIIPVVLGVGATIYNRAEQRDERQREVDKQRQETLVAYFAEMQKLLLEHHLRDSKEKDEVCIVARARTLATFRNLDGMRKGYALQFLYESALINGEKPIIRLNQADLTSAFLKGAQMEGVNLKRADLSGAILNRANLRKSNLQAVKLNDAHLENARLMDADLLGAEIEGVQFTNARMTRANLCATKIYKADFSGAYLSGAGFDGADVTKSNFENAHLNEAIIDPKDLLNANSLRNATMPDRSRYEQWLAKGRPDWYDKVLKLHLKRERKKAQSEN